MDRSTADEGRQIRVYPFDEFIGDPGATLRDIFRFLGVDAGFHVDTSRRHNVYGSIRNPIRRILWSLAYPLRNAIRPLVPGPARDAVSRWAVRDVSKPPLSADLRAKLSDRHRVEILKLQGLLQRDLSHWLETS